MNTELSAFTSGVMTEAVSPEPVTVHRKMIDNDWQGVKDHSPR